MTHYQEDELIRTNDLVLHANEFVAYIELAETKMREWRLEINQQAAKLLQQQESLQKLTEHSVALIAQHSEQATLQINSQLSQYDPLHFKRIAQESCELVQQSANDAVHKSNRLLQTVQLRFNFYAVLTTILTAFIVVLYLNGELPWEMHHKAKDERQAGRILLQAWPKLSQEEKTKIMGYINNA